MLLKNNLEILPNINFLLVKLSLNGILNTY